MTCEVTTEICGKTLSVKFIGLLDYSTAENVQVEIPPHIAKVVLLFSELEFIDSTGIGAVLSIVYQCGERGLWLEFEGLSDVAGEVFDTVGVFKIRDTLLKKGEA